jgi:hypothetical protein
MGYPVLRLTRRFTVNGAPAVGTAYITETGSNNKVRLYADAAGTQQLTGNAIALDSDGQVDCYVRAGNSTFRVTVKSAGGFVIAQDDAVVPISDNSAGGRLAPPSSTPIAYAATITPAASDAVTHISVGTLTGNITVANPTKAAVGKILVFTFTQDGTGSRTITWGSNFSLAGANGAGTANQVGATMFIYTAAGKWLQIGGALAFHAA